MTTPELAYTEIEKLVTNFKNMPAVQRKGLNEMQTRLGGFLFPTCNRSEKSAHDEIVTRVERMLALQKERQSVRPEEDLDRVRNLERQIKQVDEEIDQRVYALYGLTAEEIKVVEG